MTDLDLDALAALAEPGTKMMLPSETVTALIGELKFLRERKAKYMAGLGERFGSEVTANARADAAEARVTELEAYGTRMEAEHDKAVCDRDDAEAERDRLREELRELKGEPDGR